VKCDLRSWDPSGFILFIIGNEAMIVKKKTKFAEKSAGKFRKLWLALPRKIRYDR
jgi:hypothetical protein